MQSAIEFYQDQLQQHLKDLPGANKKQREQAMQAFVQQGWPTAKHEAWKYTRTHILQQQPLALAAEKIIDCQAEKGVVVKPLSEVIAHADFAECFSLQKNDTALNLLNHALWQEGLLINVPADVKVEQPIRINMQATGARIIKLIIVVEKNAQANIIFDYGNQVSFSNVVIHTFLHEAANFTLINNCNANDESMIFIDHQVQQQAHSHYTDYQLSLRAKWFRHNLNVHLQQAQASCELDGVYLAAKQEHFDHHLYVHHEAPHCQSKQFYKGILTDHAKAVFNGKVIVAKDAQKTNATQKNNNVLLSASAEVDTKPELEIYANDVICSHGATVGELSHDALFYLISRGIAEVDAKKILLVSFVKEIVEQLKFFKDEAEQLLEQRLGEF